MEKRIESRLLRASEHLDYIRYLEEQIDRFSHNPFYVGFLGETLRKEIKLLDDCVLPREED